MDQSPLNRIIAIIAALRHPQTGCPWDLKQTHQSLLRYLFEESYEFQQAVESGDSSEMLDELGDLLLQVLLHAQLAQDDGKFNIEDVAKNLGDKLIRRHPHVFDRTPEDQGLTPEQVESNWKDIKAQESDKTTGPAIGLRYLNHPSLRSSYLIGKRTKELNFDWEDASQVVYKVEEEWQELKEEIVPGRELNRERVAEELGDFLFSAAQLARHIGYDPEELLRAANKKFLKRFSQVEELVLQDKKSFAELNQEQLDLYWSKVKTY
jgi:MazG family protein